MHNDPNLSLGIGIFRIDCCQHLTFAKSKPAYESWQQRESCEMFGMDENLDWDGLHCASENTDEGSKRWVTLVGPWHFAC